MSENMIGRESRISMRMYIKSFLQSKGLTYVSLGLICLIAPSILYSLFGHYHFPPSGGDIGDWLRYAYGLFENRYPLWDNVPWQYPPLALITIYFLSKLTSELTSVHSIGFILMGLLPIPMFFLSKELTEKDLLAVIVALLVATSGIYYDMYYWGGLPNLMGFVFLPLAFLSAIRYIQRQTLRNMLWTSVFSMLVVLTHHLTTIILLMTLGILTLYSLVKRENLRKTIIILSTPTITFLLYRFFAGPTEYVVFNESAWYKLYVDFPTLVWVYKDVMLFIMFTILGILGFLWMYRDNQFVAVLFGAWTASPYLFCLLWVPKLVAIDFHRLPIFTLQPITILTIFFIHKVMQSQNILEVATKSLLTSILVISILTSFYSGPLLFSESVMRYFPNSDDYIYKLVTWFKENTAPSDTIVTRAGLEGRWIEGVAHRRVLIYGAPYFQFMRGQRNMCMATEALLTSNIFCQNDMFKIKDQTPVLFEQTPSIYVYHEGDYEILGFICDYFFEVNSENETESLGWGYSYKWFNSTGLSYSVRYITPHFEVTKTVSLTTDDRVDIQYVVKRTGNVEITSISLPFWVYRIRQPVYGNKTLSTNIGNISFITNAVSRDWVFDLEHDKYKIVMEFKSQENETLVSVSLATLNKRYAHDNQFSFTTSKIINEFNVTHALVSKNDQEAKRWLTMQPETWSLVYNDELYEIFQLMRDEKRL